MPYLNTAQLYATRQTRVRIDSYFDFIHLFTSLFVVLFLFVCYNSIVGFRRGNTKFQKLLP
nr:MAG TPA: hypothetical protein [Caudoviricetes sp.]